MGACGWVGDRWDAAAAQPAACPMQQQSGNELLMLWECAIGTCSALPATTTGCRPAAPRSPDSSGGRFLPPPCLQPFDTIKTRLQVRCGSGL